MSVDAPIGVRMNATTTLEEPGLLTVREAAARLHLHPVSVYRRIHAGELTAERLGSGPCAPVRIDPGELERYRAANRAQTGEMT